MPNLDNTLFMKHMRMKQRRAQQQREEMMQAGQIAAEGVANVEKIREKAFQEGLQRARDEGKVAAIRGKEPASYPNVRQEEQAKIGQWLQLGEQKKRQQQEALQKALKQMGITSAEGIASRAAADRKAEADRRFGQRQRGLDIRQQRADAEDDKAAAALHTANLTGQKRVSDVLNRTLSALNGVVRTFSRDVYGDIPEKDIPQFNEARQAQQYLLELSSRLAGKMTPDEILAEMIAHKVPRGIATGVVSKIPQAGTTEGEEEGAEKSTEELIDDAMRRQE